MDIWIHNPEKTGYRYSSEAVFPLLTERGRMFRTRGGGGRLHHYDRLGAGLLRLSAEFAPRLGEVSHSETALSEERGQRASPLQLACKGASGKERLIEHDAAPRGRSHGRSLVQPELRARVQNNYNHKKCCCAYFAPRFELFIPRC